jgi:signal transduction histidine kinase
MENKSNIRENLEFFSRITASVTHELTNVLSIINEYNGLLEDQIYKADKGEKIQPDKLDRIQTKLNNQIQRGKSIIKRLNYFAHSVDSEYSEFDLVFLIKNMILLTERFTSMKNIKIIEEYQIESLNLQSNPFLIQRLLFLCIMVIVDNSQEDSLIKVSFIKNENYIISIETDQICATDSEGSEKFHEIEDIIRTLDLQSDFDKSDNMLKIKISIRN